MAAQYGATIRRPGSKISSTDPQQQALLDAMQTNGAPDSSPDALYDRFPGAQTSQPRATDAGPNNMPGASRTTMPVPVDQGNQPTNTVSGGVSSSGSLSAPSPGGPTLPTSMGQYSGSMSGFDAGKLSDPNKHDPKYDFARIMSQFDPRQGVSQDMLGQLSGLGYGSVSGSGDKIHIDNPSAAFNGMSDFDVVQGMNGGNGQWAWQPEGGGQTGQPAQSAAPQATADPASSITQLQTAANGGDSYSALVLKYLMQQLGLDQGMLSNSQ